jgi:hypothetical protein
LNCLCDKVVKVVTNSLFGDVVPAKRVKEGSPFGEAGTGKADEPQGSVQIPKIECLISQLKSAEI